MSAKRTIPPAEFAAWHRPVAALAILEDANFHTAASTIAKGLVAGGITAAAETLTFEGATVHRALIPAGLWRGWDCGKDFAFWVTGDFFRIVADPGSLQADHRVEAFGVRFAPRGLEPLLGALMEPSSRRPKTPSAGRRAGKNGEPIARVVKGLLKLPSPQLADYKVETVAAELAEQYRALGLNPPHPDNAKRDASGILRALSEPTEN